MQYSGTFSTKRPYDDQPRLIITGNPFYYRIGYNNQPIRCIVKGRSGTFGDFLPYELAGLNIKFNVFNSNGVLVFRKTAVISDLDTSEIIVEWGINDLKTEGYYVGEFIFTNVIDNSTFILPQNSQRIQIVCNS